MNFARLFAAMVFAPIDAPAGGAGDPAGGAAAGAPATGTAPVIATTVIGDAVAAGDKAASDATATEAKAGDPANGVDNKADPGAGDKTADKGKDGKAADPNAPIEYTDFKLPDGVEVDAPALTEAKTLFAEMRLPQDQAQRLIDTYVKRQTEFGQRLTDNWLALNKKWVDDFKADKEFGGDRVNETIGAVHSAVRKFGDADLDEALRVTGAGNHPAVVRFFARVGKATARDPGVVKGDSGSGTIRPTAEVMYETMAKKE